MDTPIFQILIVGLIGLLFWFIRDKFGALTKTDERIETKVENIVGKTGEISASIVEMQDTFNRMGYPMQRVLTSMSPTKLTEYGEKLVEESGFNRVFSENKESIVGWVKQLNPSNPYDAQEISRKILIDHKDDAIFTSLKDYAFQHGGTSIEQILRAGSIVVRDEVIKELNLGYG